MNPSLKERIALVSGAGGGVGRGIALALAQAGARIIVAARRAATGLETVRLIREAGGHALCVETDISRRIPVEQAVAAGVAEFGRLDIVVHNAVSGLSGVPVQLEDIDAARLEEEAGIALDGAFFLARAAFPHLRDHGRGRFIVLTSVEGVHGGSVNPVYGLTKAGQRGFVKALAREWGPHRINVYGLTPAALTDSAREHFRRFPDAEARVTAAIPLGRMGDPQSDIGAAAVALCGDDLHFVTGQILNVNGGYYTAL